jgi:hypothetical protein
MPSAGSSHRAGRRRPRAAASISGAHQPRKLRRGRRLRWRLRWTGSGMARGWGQVVARPATAGHRTTSLSHVRGPGDQGGSRASRRDRFVTLRLISAIQESGRLFTCQDGQIRTSPTVAGPKEWRGKAYPVPRWVYLVEPVAAAAGGRTGTRCGPTWTRSAGAADAKDVVKLFFITRLSHCYAAQTGRSLCSVTAGQFRSTRGR